MFSLVWCILQVFFCHIHYAVSLLRVLSVLASLSWHWNTMEKNTKTNKTTEIEKTKRKLNKIQRYKGTKSHKHRGSVLWLHGLFLVFSIVCISGFFVTEFAFFIYIFLVVIYYIFHQSVYCLTSIRLGLVWVLPASLSSCFILAVLICLMWSSRWLIRLIIFSCSPTCSPLIIHECIYCLWLCPK